MVLPAGGAGGLATGVAMGLEPMTGMDIPCSCFGGETSDDGGLSTYTRTGFLGGLILLSSGVEAGWHGLLTGVGELNGVPMSVSLELSS